MDLLIAALFVLRIYQVSGLSVRLVGGNSSFEGRVEVYYNGEWGTICDDSFEINDAKVVCHMLGYQRNGATAYILAKYGQGSGKIWLDDLGCNGFESSVNKCGKRNDAWGSHNCGHHEDAGVRCLLNGCQQLAQITNGRLTPYACTTSWSTYGTVCRLVCDSGYEGSTYRTTCLNTKKWSLSGSYLLCLDEDECSTNTAICTQQCSNTEGSYECSCRNGYILSTDQHTCNDIDECSSQADICPQRCSNTDGSYECSCTDGYYLSIDKTTCDDIDECSLNTSHCNQQCINNGGSYECSCRNGYTLSIDQQTCNDIDECKDNSSSCEHQCVNTEGSYNCFCDTGYMLSSDNKACHDIDECVTITGICSQHCSNTDGSYECSCTDGYYLSIDNTTCDDIDECQADNGGCQHNCWNEAGTYNCTCDKGHSLGDDYHSCNDINECLVNNGGCEDECINRVGSYQCRCKTGHILSADNHNCEDINECLVENGGCSQNCLNNDGTYTCSCDDGYKLGNDSHTCEAVDYLVVSVKTGSMFGAGTDAFVHVALHGLNGETERIRFNGSTGRDEVKEMRMEAKDILPIKSVEIGHDGSGIAPGWFLEYASVYVENMEEYYVFRYNGWVYEHNDVVLQREGDCINSFDNGQLWEPNWRAIGYTYIDMERNQRTSLRECKQACVIRGQSCFAIRYDTHSRRCMGFTVIRARFFTDYPQTHKTRKLPVHLRRCKR